MEENIKKGTTTVGVVCRDGVVIAADKRASMGYLISNKEVDKVFKISDFIAMTIAGSAADGQKLAQFLKAEMDMYRMNVGVEPSLTVASSLMANIVFGRAKTFIPYIVQLIIGGKDTDGFALYTLDMGGSNIKENKFNSTGSGSPMAFGVMEDLWKENMSVEEGADLAVKALASAIKRDMGTGEGVDVVVIDQNGYRKIKGERIKAILEAKSVRL